MFIKASTLVLAFVALVNAVPQPNLAVRTSGDTNQCNTGEIQCCTEDYSSSGALLLGLQGLLGGCSPISVLGLGSGSNCEADPVCCDDVSSDGLGINCSPVNVNL